MNVFRLVEDHQVEWGITLASPAASASFTITIPSNIVVSLSSLAFDYGFDDTQNNKVTPSYNLTLSHGSATPSSASLGKVPDTETWTNETAVLSGLSHLSGTNITFTWTFAIQENLSNWNRRHLLDNIVLTGTAIEGGVVAWDFDDESNQYGDVALTNAPDVNTFTGNGVTVSGLFMEGGKAGHATMGVYIADKSGTDTKRAEWSVNNDHPMPDGLMETASFTVTIPAGISLALTTLQYDHGFYEPSGLNTLEPYVNLSVSVGSASPNYNDFGSDTPGSAPDIPAGDNWERNLQSTLTGMGALINTTVTFTWTFDDSENRGHPDRRHLLDNIELWGVLTVLPKGTLILVQ